MSTGQRVQFAKMVEVTTSLVAHPSGVLEIARHSDHHELQRLFGPPKDVNGHSDAEVMLYLLAAQTGWFDKFADQHQTPTHSVSSEPKIETHRLTIEAGFVSEDRFVMHTRRDDGPRQLVCNVPFWTPAEAKDKILGTIEARQSDEQIVYVELSVIGRGASLFDYLKAEQHRVGFAITARRTPFSPAQSVAESAKQTANNGDSLRKRVVMYAEAIGVQTTKDGNNLATEDIVGEIFSRVSAGGEAAAADILPGRQELLAKWRSSEATPADIAEDMLGLCQRALALWIARENFLRHKFRGLMNRAAELLIHVGVWDGDQRAQWLTSRDELLESIQWIDTDMASKGYHPSHDAEKAFNVLYNGLGFDAGIAKSLSSLAELAVARLRNAPPAPIAPPEHPAEVDVHPIVTERLNGVRPTQNDIVVGGPQRPTWHSGIGQTGQF